MSDNEGMCGDADFDNVCRNGHEEIGHRNFRERCPLCLVLAELATLRAERQRLLEKVDELNTRLLFAPKEPTP